jgi:hypothetical protein
LFYSFIDEGLPFIVYFKVALIILSSNITYVCGYKCGIDKINEYIRMAGVTTSISNIASLGENEIHNLESRDNQKSNKKSGKEKEDVEDVDNQKYFTALTMSVKSVFSSLLDSVVVSFIRR